MGQGMEQHVLRSYSAGMNEARLISQVVHKATPAPFRIERTASELTLAKRIAHPRQRKHAPNTHLGPIDDEFDEFTVYARG